MKHIYTSLITLATLIFGFASCQTIETESSSNTNDKGVKFYAESIETKTAFGTISGTSYPTLWTDNDSQVYISQNKASSVAATVTPDAGYATAVLTPASEITDDGTGSYVFYALSPSSAQVSKINTQYYSWSIEIPANQTPITGSVDESAQILYASHDAGNTFPESVSFAFGHVTAYGKISFSNLSLSAGETVSSVTLESPEYWVGRWYYYVADNGTNYAGDMVAYSASKTITLSTSSTSDIWFACAPVDLSGQDVDVTIATNLGTYSKTITFTTGGTFEAGKVKSFTINMSGITRTDPVVYTKVTDVSDLTLGSEIIIVNSDGSYGAAPIGSGSYLGQTAVTLSGTTISDPGSAVEVFKIANGNVGGTYALQCSSDSDNYLTWSSGTSLTSSSSLTNAASWAITITDGSATIRNISDNTRYLLYNSGNSRFTTYLTSTSGYPVIYKNASTGSGSINAKTAASIAISNATTAYTIGSTYSFNGTVTLTYSDLSTTTLTSSDYTVDSSNVNMSTAGEYTVTVTYGADPSISTSYKITVSTSSEVTATLTLSSSKKFGTSSGSSLSDDKSNTWTVTTTGGTGSIQNTYSNDYSGQQFGTSSKPWTGTFTSPITGTITKVVVKANTGNAATLAVSVGSTSFTCGENTSVSVTKHYQETIGSYEFTGSGTGTVTVTLTGTTKACYLGEIAVTYTNN